MVSAIETEKMREMMNYLLDSSGSGEEEKGEEGEFQRFYHAGRMDVLFNLVYDGKISLDEAAAFAGMSIEEAYDMLNGWKEAQEMQGKGRG